MAVAWWKLRVRGLVFMVIVATLAGIPLLFTFHKPSALRLHAALVTSVNCFLGVDDNPDPHSDLVSVDSTLGVDENPELTSGERKILRDLLKKASMVTPNKTVIITTLNQAWADEGGMLDVYLEGFRQGDNIQHLVKNLIVVALDQKAYDRCLHLRKLHCFMLRTYGVDFSAEKRFNTPDYLKMMWRRIKFLRSVLEMGYSFIFSDADIVWLRNPFTQLIAENIDLQINCDRYHQDPESLANDLNAGFLYTRANDRTIEFYNYWYAAREQIPGQHDQHVLRILIREQHIADKFGLKIHFLDTRFFSGFCQISDDIEHICTMHANCCIGLELKLKDLRSVLTTWKEFKSQLSLEGAKKQPLHSSNATIVAGNEKKVHWQVPSPNCM